MASGTGSTVGSGGTSKWTVPCRKARDGRPLQLVRRAASTRATPAARPPARRGTARTRSGSMPTARPTAASTRPPVPARRRRTSSRTRPAADTCTGTDGFCDATSDEIAAAGVSTAELDSAAVSEQDVTVPEGGSPASTNFTGRWGWLIFELVWPATAGCGANPVVDNGYCGNLWHSWAQYSNGVPTAACTAAASSRAPATTTRPTGGSGASAPPRHVGLVGDAGGRGLPPLGLVQRPLPGLRPPERSGLLPGCLVDRPVRRSTTRIPGRTRARAGAPS